MDRLTKERTILIIEDDDHLRANTALILSMEGYHVTVAADGATGLAMLRRKRPDMILCDILLPTMNGFEVFETIKSNPFLAEIPFLFISALNERQQIRQGMVMGADDYLGKPFSREELIAAVAARLDRFAALGLVGSEDGIDAMADSEKRLRQITRREREVLILVASGFTSKAIATTLKISYRTVEVHRSKLIKKLGVTNATGLVHWAKLLERSRPDDSR
jgi:DNA-binding NarL/FixJ family response regulator